MKRTEPHTHSQLQQLLCRQSLTLLEVDCISNISLKPQSIALADINLINTDTWYDLISGEPIVEDQQSLELEPYQTVWLSNAR